MNLISWKTLTRGAAIDSIWSNAFTSGVWDCKWDITGVSGGKIKAFGIVMLPVIGMDNKQRMLHFGVVNMDRCMLIIGTPGLREMNFKLSCQMDNAVNLLDESPFETSPENMTDYLLKIYDDETGRPNSIYERFLKKKDQVEKSTILFYEDNHIDAAIAAAVDVMENENYVDPIYAKAMRQRLRTHAQRKELLAKFTCPVDYKEKVHYIATRMYAEKDNDSFFVQKGHFIQDSPKRTPLSDIPIYQETGDMQSEDESEDEECKLTLIL